MAILPPGWTNEQMRNFAEFTNMIMEDHFEPFKTSIGFKIDKWDERVSRMKEGSNGFN